MDIIKKINNYLKEDAPERRIYFAHPQKYYNTRLETISMQLINKKWPNHVIINPSGPKWPRRAAKLGFQPFYQAIRLAEFSVFMPLDETGKLLSGGAYKEAVRTDKLKKDIWIVNPWKKTLKKVKLSDIRGISKDDPYYKTYLWDED